MKCGPSLGSVPAVAPDLHAVLRAGAPLPWRQRGVAHQLLRAWGSLDVGFNVLPLFVFVWPFSGFSIASASAVGTYSHEAYGLRNGNATSRAPTTAWQLSP